MANAKKLEPSSDCRIPYFLARFYLARSSAGWAKLAVIVRIPLRPNATLAFACSTLHFTWQINHLLIRETIVDRRIRGCRSDYCRYAACIICLGLGSETTQTKRAPPIGIRNRHFCGSLASRANYRDSKRGLCAANKASIRLWNSTFDVNKRSSSL